MRIAMLGLRAPWGTEGGVEQAVSELAPRLVSKGCAVTVYCRGRYNPHGNSVREGVRLVDSPTLYGRSSEAMIHTALAAPRASLRHDLVHIHAAGPAIFSLLPRLMGRPTVVTLHGKDWERDKWGPTARKLLWAGGQVGGHVATRLIAVSEDLRNWCQENFPAPVDYVPNGVSPHHPMEWDYQTFPMLQPRSYYLYLGRLVPEKELDTLLKAAHRVGPRFPIVIAGGSGYTDNYVARLRREAPPGVVFVGSRYGLEKRMLLTHARAFLFPSRVEGFSIALLEAMAAGLPVVASDIPPNREALGETAKLLPPGRVDRWAETIASLDHKPNEELAAMGSRYRERVTRLFGWDRATEETLAVYRQALE